ncbi:ribosomal prt S11 [Nucleospora cyclopteri]
MQKFTLQMIKTHTKDKIYPKQNKTQLSPYATEEEVLKSRIVREVGFGIKTPQTVYENYVDKKCPFTGEVRVTGRIFNGQVIKMKAEKTIVVAIKYLFYDHKYKRYARRNTKINVHLSPCWNGLVKLGDTVTCGETRPLSKTKAAAVIAISKKAEDKTAKVFNI